jgi:DNA-binding protein YbaB
MMKKEMLEALFKKLLNDSLEHLEKRNKNEMDCLTVLQTNMKNIESKYNYINIIN